MIGYFMQPFIALSDEQVQASISADISRPENKTAIASAPDQFQVWRLGEIDDEGDVTTGKVLICNCVSLIRVGRESAESGSGKVGTTQGNSQTGNSRLGSVAGTRTGAVQESPQAELAADETARNRAN